MAPATKATQKRLDAAVSSFNARYADSKQWGEERWYNSLYPALAQPTTYSAIINQYAVSEEEGRRLLRGSENDSLRRVEMPNLSEPGDAKEQNCSSAGLVCYQRSTVTESDGDVASSIPFPTPKPGPASVGHLLSHWNMDAASVLAAYMLDVRPGDHVLDMCAAPGGKSIVSAQKLFPQLHVGSASGSVARDTVQGCLHVNEFDSTRYKRLSSNLKSYLPGILFPTPETPQAAVRVLNKDLSAKGSVSLLPFGANGYDKVLIDAPCSSERHIVHAYGKSKASGQVAEEMLNWKSSHVTTLVKTQAGLLHTALRATRIGGRIVYATCALGSEENDGVIEKVLDVLKTERKKAKKDGHVVDNWDVEFQLGTTATSPISETLILQNLTESTKYGRIALPDHGGWGPLYFSIIVKVARIKRSKVTTKSDDARNQVNSTATLLDANDGSHTNH